MQENQGQGLPQARSAGGEGVREECGRKPWAALFAVIEKTPELRFGNPREWRNIRPRNTGRKGLGGGQEGEGGREDEIGYGHTEGPGAVGDS